MSSLGLAARVLRAGFGVSSPLAAGVLRVAGFFAAAGFLAAGFFAAGFLAGAAAAFSAGFSSAAFLAGARLGFDGPIESIWIRLSSERWPRVFLNPRLGLNVKTLSFSPRRCSTTWAVTAPSSFVAVGHDVVAAGHEHGGRERLSRLHGLAVDQERLPLLDLVLLAADFDDRVHEPRNGTKGLPDA